MFDYEMIHGIYRRFYSGALTGRRINGVSMLAESLFWRLNMISDDYGTFQADPQLVLAEALPLRRDVTTEQVKGWLAELSAPATALIELYDVAGEPFGNIIGFIEMQPARSRNGRRLRRFPLPVRLVQPDNPSNSKHIQANPEGLDALFGANEPLDAQKGALGKSSAQIEIEIEIENEIKKHTYARAELEKIYQAYPRKIGKDKALPAIAKALSKIHVRDKAKNINPVVWLLDKVEAYAKSPAGQAGQYTPYPATWFNQARYDDDPDEWQRPRDGEPMPTKPRMPANFTESGT